MFAEWLAFNPRSKATNIGYLLSSEADSGYRSKIRICIEEFKDSLESCNFMRKYSNSIMWYQKGSTTILPSNFSAALFGKNLKISRSTVILRENIVNT